MNFVGNDIPDKYRKDSWFTNNKKIIRNIILILGASITLVVSNYDKLKMMYDDYKRVHDSSSDSK